VKEENKEDRSLFFKEVNLSAEKAGLPIDKDSDFLSKKLTSYMQSSRDDIPLLVLEEGLASTPYLVKAALADGKGEGALASDLAEVEAALMLLKVPGWQDGETTGRPPFVRRNLLLLHAHLHRERLRAVTLAESTQAAAAEVVTRCRRLLDLLFSVCLTLNWVKAALAITSLQAMLVNGLWDPTDDDCKSHMKSKLQAAGMKVPKVSLRCEAGDVGPGEAVKVSVTIVRSHSYSPVEMEAFRRTSATAEGDAEGDAEGAEAAAQEGWWLLAESLRNVPRHKGALLQEDALLHHNMLIGRQAISPTLDQETISTELTFEAPTSPGEYKVLVHLRSASILGSDAKRKVSFTVKNGKRPLPSFSSGTSTEPAESMEAMEEAIAELEEEEQMEVS